MKQLQIIFSAFFYAGCLFTNLEAISQDASFKKGQKDLQVGVGFISTLNVTIIETGWGEIAKSTWTTPPVSLSFDYAVNDEMSIGLYVAKAKSKITYYGDEFETDIFSIVGIRGLYHFPVSEKIDAYGGGMLGITSIKSNQASYGESYSAKASQLGYQLLAGGRYRFSKNVGAYVELGYGIAVFNLGLNVKF